MREAWEAMTIYTFNRISGGELFFGVFFVTLLVIFIYEKDQKIKNIFGLYSVIFTAIYLFPLTSYFLLRAAVDVSSYYRMFWLLPAFLVIPYVFVKWESEITLKRNKRFFIIGVLIFFIFRSETSYSRIEISENPYGISSAVIEIIEIINADAEALGLDVKPAIVTTQIHSFVRQYDASVVMPIGGASWAVVSDLERTNANVQEIFRIIRNNLDDGISLSRLIKEEEFNYLVIWRDHPALERIGGGFVEIGEVLKFSIWRVDDFEIKCTIFQGVDYSLVFDYHYYINRYLDVIIEVGDSPEDVLEHFVTVGMQEGRRGNRAFNLEYYFANYEDLEQVFADIPNCAAYYHYMESGHAEGKVASRRFPIYDGENYDMIFNYEFFVREHPELAKNFVDQQAALEFFIHEGLDMGIQGSSKFDVFFYKERYKDVYLVFGDDLRSYYVHFLTWGIEEQRRGAPTLDQWWNERLEILNEGTFLQKLVSREERLNHLND